MGLIQRIAFALAHWAINKIVQRIATRIVAHCIETLINKREAA
jgi:hypothetical protein